MRQRQFSFFDKCCLAADVALRTLTGNAKITERPSPVINEQPTELNLEETKLSIGLMRINHCGEVCAQALYQGQGLTAKLPDVRQSMEQAALEENDHLTWCRDRVEALGSHTSYLDPIFYLSSFAIGSIAGLLGDKWSLGFVAETERQVVKHLSRHLMSLPPSDHISRSIILVMQKDEQQHALLATNAGGAELPHLVKQGMQLTAKIMTKTTFHL